MLPKVVIQRCHFPARHIANPGNENVRAFSLEFGMAYASVVSQSPDYPKPGTVGETTRAASHVSIV
jgi:hypothetical protein